MVPLVLAPFLIGIGLSAQTAAAASPLLVFASAVLALVLNIWGWVEIGFLRGRADANRYGEAPTRA